MNKIIRKSLRYREYRSLKTDWAQIRHHTNGKILQCSIQRRKNRHRRFRAPHQSNKILHRHSIQRNITHLMRHDLAVIDNLSLIF